MVVYMRIAGPVTPPPAPQTPKGGLFVQPPLYHAASRNQRRGSRDKVQTRSLGTRDRRDGSLSRVRLTR
ncbi:Uncharacterized protein HZ326_16986 [Fusarium oxysporum f. sp. albedinis]|nr:Uncharacterized protein HZ326_16986 [Fusarium oxysporum f. sp. albedinis]